MERIVAAAMFAHDAPRVGNDHQSFDDLEGAEQRRFLAYARIAITLLNNVSTATTPEVAGAESAT